MTMLMCIQKAQIGVNIETPAVYVIYDRAFLTDSSPMQFFFYLVYLPCETTIIIVTIWLHRCMYIYTNNINAKLFTGHVTLRGSQYTVNPTDSVIIRVEEYIAFIFVYD